MRTMTRREAMEAFGIGALAAAFLPRELRAERAGQDKIILGDGKHRYEWIKGWAKLPEGKTFAPTHGCVQVDSKDNVYVNTDNSDAVIVFDKDGKFLRSWGKDIAGGSAHGMTIVKEGDKEVVFVAHTGRHKVYKATLEGQVLLEIPWPQVAGIYKGENNYQPTMVSIAPSGDIYVAAGYGSPNQYLHQFDKEGKYVRSWNGEKTEGGPLNNVHGVWIDKRGAEPLVMAVDRGNNRLVHYTLDGKYVAVIAKNLKAPCKAYTLEGDVLVPNLRGGCTILDRENKVVAYIGENQDGFAGKFDTPVDKWKDGQFTAPHGACWDSKGDLYVEDWNKYGRVNKLKRLA
jgi:DNA-binding beta-propeller fold protein YncE